LRVPAIFLPVFVVSACVSQCVTIYTRTLLVCQLFSYIIKKELFGRFFCIKLNSSSIFFISSARCECASYHTHTHTLVLYVHTYDFDTKLYIYPDQKWGVGIKKRYEVKKFFVFRFFVFVCILRVCVCVYFINAIRSL